MNSQQYLESLGVHVLSKKELMNHDMILKNHIPENVIDWVLSQRICIYEKRIHRLFGDTRNISRNCKYYVMFWVPESNDFLCFFFDNLDRLNQYIDWHIKGSSIYSMNFSIFDIVSNKEVLPIVKLDLEDKI